MKIPLNKEERHQKSTESLRVALENFRDTPDNSQFTPGFPFKRIFYSSVLDADTDVEIYYVDYGNGPIVEVRFPELLAKQAH